MKIQIIDDNTKVSDYNAKVDHPMQAWQWGEARKAMGIEVLRLTDGKTNYQLTFHKIPYTNFKIGYLPRSPVPTHETLDFLTDYGRKHNVAFIKIEPYSFKKSSIRNSKFVICNSPHPLFPDWTLLLDLKPTEDELLKQMKSKTRYNIRLAQKKGVVIKEESSDKGFQKFSKLYFDTCRRQKYHGHSPAYHKIIWDNLKQDIAHILIAYYENEPVAAYELFFFNKILYYPYGGTSESHRNVMAPNVLMWEAIRFGKKMNAERFDMWGAAPLNYEPTHPWSGFTRFKEGYGGKFAETIGSYDLVINNLAYNLYSLAYKLRAQFL